MALRIAPLCFAILLILAGCTGTQSPEVGTSGQDAETTTSPTPEPTTTTATATTNRAGTTTSPTHATLDTEELSTSDHELLGQAVENGSVQVRRSNLSGRLTPDTDGWYTRYGGTLYELSWQPAGFRGEYRLENVTKVNSSAVDSSDGVIVYTNLSADARQLFNVVRSGNESEVYGAEVFPDQFQEYAYVKDDGDYYSLEIVVGDFIVYRLSVTEVES